MWQTHGPRQRILLVLAGAFLVAIGGVLALGNKLLPSGSAGSPRIDDFVPWAGEQMAYAVLAIASLLALVCLWIILGAMPRKPPIRTLRYTNAAGANTVIKTDVIARAAQEAAEHSGVITTARIRVSGSADAPTLYAAFTVRSDRPLVAALNLINQRIVPDMETVIGTEFRAKHIKYDIGGVQTKQPTSLELTSLPTTMG